MYYKKGEFLSTDNKILKILIQAKKEGNPLLKYFEIKNILIKHLMKIIILFMWHV